MFMSLESLHFAFNRISLKAKPSDIQYTIHWDET